MKVLVSDKLSQNGVAILESYDGLEVDVKTGMTPEELKAVIGDYEGLVIRSATKVTADVLAVASKLKVIGRAGIGVDNVDLEAASRKGVVVMNTPGGNIVTTAEHTVSMLMSVSRKIPQATASLKTGKWEKSKFMGSEMMNKTLGVIGMGRIGKIVVDRCQGLKMKVIAFDPFISAVQAKEMNVELVDLDTLFKRSDYITIHTPITDETRGMINKETIAKMKKGVYLINCARGGIINESDLADALNSGYIAGAALDVFEKEPVSADNPLLTAQNFVCTPHIAASTTEAQENVAIAIAHQIAGYLLEGKIENAVNFPSLDAGQMEKLQPYLFLAESIGAVQAQLVDKPITSVHITFSGDVAELNCKPVTNALMKGILSATTSEEINLVNAQAFAKDRGIDVVESISNKQGDFHSLLSVEVSSETESKVVEGTIFGKKDARIVKIDDFRIEARPSAFMLFFSNKDEPGVIGNIGTLLGNRKVNMADMQLGRTTPHGKAVAIVNVDTKLSAEILEEIKHLDNILDARMVCLPL